MPAPCRATLWYSFAWNASSIALPGVSQRADEIEEGWLAGVGTLGLTAGASAPEELVREVIARLGQWREVEERTFVSAEENMRFKLPRQLTE